MAAPDPAAVARFRDAVAAALAASDRPAFDAAARALATASRLPLLDCLALPPVQADPHLPALLAVATDLHWLHPDLDPVPPVPSPHHIFRPPSGPPRPFLPALPPHPLPLPTALAPSPSGPRPSFRSWKWNRPAQSPLDPSLHSLPSPVRPSHLRQFALHPPHDDDPLLSAMHPTPATRPAAATAAAAFRALAPYLTPHARANLRTTLASSTPLHALSAVLQAAHLACTDDTPEDPIPPPPHPNPSPPAWPPDPARPNGLPFAALPDDRTPTPAWPPSRVWAPDARDAAWGPFSPPRPPPPTAADHTQQPPSSSRPDPAARGVHDVRASFLTHPSLDSPG